MRVEASAIRYWRERGYGVPPWAHGLRLGDQRVRAKVAAAHRYVERCRDDAHLAGLLADLGSVADVALDVGLSAERVRVRCNRAKGDSLAMAIFAVESLFGPVDV